MAQNIINVGTGNNTGDGEPLRSAMIKSNNNFTELYNEVSNIENIAGWGYYQDDATSDLTVTTSDTLFTVNGLGSNSNSSYLPLDIRGVSELWSSNKMNAITLGDGYDVRVDFSITSKTGSPTYLDLIFDIGGGATPTINVVERTISLVKIPPYKISVAFPLFSLSTFIANGGQIFLKTDTGAVTIGARAVLIKRDFKDI